MIQLLTDLPAGVVGIEAVGHVEAEDSTRVVEPAVREALDRSDKVRLLYVLGEQFEGYSAAASWADAKLASVTGAPGSGSRSSPTGAGSPTRSGRSAGCSRAR